MTNVLILGAGGQIAGWVIQMLSAKTSVQMTLFARHPAKLERHTPRNGKVVRGDVLNRAELDAAVAGQAIVYANLTGDDLDAQAEAIVASMQAADIERLIFVLALGVHNEVPGEFGAWNERMIGEELKSFRRAAEVIEAARLNHTIVRPAWLMDDDEIDYEVTERNEPFKGTVVSRKSVADLIAKVIETPTLHMHASLGVNKPNTDGDKPYFM